jgi:hypothetical protein
MSVITQNHILNIVPGMSAPLVVHVSQGDSGVELEFTLVNGDEIFDPTGTVISVHGIRQDGVGWGPVACARENGNIKFTLPDAATAVKGSGMAEISISNSTETVGTTNFAILVETATFPQGVTYANDVSVYEAILAYVDQMGEQSVANVEADLAAEIANRQAADAVLQGEINTNAHNISTNANDIATANGVIASHSSQIQTLTNNLSAETTARQTADSSEALTRSSADANLQAQIDQIIAPSGEAPSAAEVENARVGADGETYDTLGNAIRTQISNIQEKTYNLVEGSIPNATINSSGAIYSDSSYDVYYAPIELGKSYCISCDESRAICGFYTSKPALMSLAYDSTRVIEATKKVTAPITGYIAFRVTTGYKYAQIEEGSTHHIYLPPITATDDVARIGANKCNELSTNSITFKGKIVSWSDIDSSTDAYIDNHGVKHNSAY